MEKSATIFIAGINGMVGSAIARNLRAKGFLNIVGGPRGELDLTRQAEVEAYFEKTRPDYVFLAAAKVGGIMANKTYPADFIYSNICIQTNIIEASFRYRVRKLLFLGSSCIYPRDCPQPMKESHLLTGLLEPTNESYALAKIAGIKMCQAYNRQHYTRFISCMPTNLYGPGDNYDLQNSHVLPALIRKVHEAKENGDPAVTVWGTGLPLREFLYVDDLAEACYLLMQEYLGADTINVGSGEEVSIRDLTELVKSSIGYEGQIIFDTSKPDGTPRKLLDASRITALGWAPYFDLERGIAKTYADFQARVIRESCYISG